MMQQSTVPHKTEVKVENTIKVPPNLVTAQRVAELLKAAGETFCRLGDCTMLLQPQTANPVKTKVSTVCIRREPSQVYHFRLVV